jgi:hypothetical protein
MEQRVTVRLSDSAVTDLGLGHLGAEVDAAHVLHQQLQLGILACHTQAAMSGNSTQRRGTVGNQHRDGPSSPNGRVVQSTPSIAHPTP